jgi:hypothetical protein
MENSTPNRNPQINRMAIPNSQEILSIKFQFILGIKILGCPFQFVGGIVSTI